MHGGRISARSEGLGKGSGFSVVLPLAATRERTDTAPPASASVVIAPAPKRILVVDDNEDAAAMMGMLLNRLGHEVRVAHNGVQALEAGASLLPHAVLMDLGMPVMDGYSACRRMRASAWGANALIVALSGWGQDEDRRKSRDAGFDHHLVKPIPSDEILTLLAAVDVRS
jgi:CheY-like chemotaxis protein